MFDHTVVLKPHKEGPYIQAPSFCPYKFVDSWQSQQYIVHSSLCPLCKICKFVPDIESMEGLPPTQEERDAFAKYLTQDNLKLSASLSGQSQYLLKSDRIPLTVLISVTVLREMFQQVVLSEARRQELLSLYTNQEVPVCYVLGCPVYFSRKLTKSRIQVVGEVEWR